MQRTFKILMTGVILTLFLYSVSFSQSNLRTDPRFKNLKDNSGRLIPRRNFQEKTNQTKNNNMNGFNSSVIENSDDISIPVFKNWAEIFSSPYSDFLTDMAIDGSGNVYVTGFTFGDGIITIKYNSSGDSVWVARHTGGTYAIAVDGLGNVYVAGGDQGACIIKYNSTGVEQWVKTYTGPGGYDVFTDLVLDAAGNVFVSGISMDIGYDMIAVKYNSAGDEQWLHRFSQPGNFDIFTFPVPIALDASNNVYVTDMLIIDDNNSDYFTAKLNSGGIQQWAKTFDYAGSFDFPNAIAADNAGNIAVAGGITKIDFTTSYATVKYNTSGNEQWTNTYDNAYNGATDVKFDNTGNIYITGTAGDVAHPEDYTDYVTIKYNTNGVSLWVAKYGGIIHSGDFGWVLDLDNAGNVYVTGQSSSLNDLYWEIATISYDASGAQRWVARYANSDFCDNTAYHIKVTGSGFGNVYVSGRTTDAITYQDFATIKYSQENPLPVELSSFNSTVNNRDATLNWSTASETNNSGFDIERSFVNAQWSKVGSVKGKGTTTSANNYTYTDRELNSGRYNYRLKQIDYNGNFQYFILNNEVSIGIPDKFNLSQNYPNPFNPSTKINYDISFEGKVSLKLFDITGKEVASLVNDVQTAGYYSVTFNGSNLSSGIYFYRLISESNGQSYSETKKMNLIK